MDRQKLISAGIDYDEGVHRFGGNSQIYEKYLLKFFEGNLMDELLEKLQKKDITNAFRIAHSLKGTSGNVSVNSFYKKICELVELLRSGQENENCMPVFEQAQKLYMEAKKAVKEQENGRNN